MEFTVHELRGQRFVEGAPGEHCIEQVEDVVTALEACFDHAVHALLLYPENLTSSFFDLSSGEAGAILQKLRNYHIRLAVVRSTSLRLSSRFAEVIADENSGPYFRLCDDRPSAQEWLCFG